MGMPGNKRNKNPITRDDGFENFMIGVEVGTQWKREIAAYRFAKRKLGNVPTTCQFVYKNPKDPLRTPQEGSLQEFISNGESYDDIVIKQN